MDSALVTEWIKKAQFYSDTFGKNQRIPKKDWIEKVESSHDQIRKLIGSVEVVMPCEISKENRSLSSDRCDFYYQRLYKIIPGYFTRYRFDATLFGKQKIGEIGITKHVPEQIARKNKQIKNFVTFRYAGMSVAKHIIRYLQLYRHELHDPENISALVCEIISAWGIELAKMQTKEYKMWAKLSTNALDFASIGHYGCDEKSCFRQTGCNSHHKYLLGRHPNSFVMVVTDKEDHNFDPESPYNLARLWGVSHFPSGKSPFFDICNYYTNGKAHDGTVRESIKSVFAKLLGLDIGSIAIATKAFSISGVYHNGRDTVEHPINWTIYNPKEYNEITLPTLIGRRISVNESMEFCLSCPICLKLSVSEDQTLALESHKGVCKVCYERAKTCPISGKKYLSEATIIMNGKRTAVSTESVNKLTMSNLLKNINGYLVHVDDILVDASGVYTFKLKLEENQISFTKKLGLAVRDDFVIDTTDINAIEEVLNDHPNILTATLV